MDPALYEPVEVTDMRLVAKAAIVVYREKSTGRLWIDPDLPQNPLFRLGDVKGEDGEDGVVDPLVIQACADATTAAANAATAANNVVEIAEGAADAANTAANLANAAATAAPKNYVLSGSTVNSSRAGVVLGLAIQSVDSAVGLIGRVVVFRGLLKLVSTATGTASMQANIGGLIFTFPNIALAANTQYVNFEVTAHVISAAVGFASVRQSIALNGVAANAVQANNVAQSGAASTNTALIQFKSPATTQVTTLLAVCEVL